MKKQDLVQAFIAKESNPMKYRFTPEGYKRFLDVKQYFSDGHSPRWIAKKMGIDRQLVQQWRKINNFDNYTIQEIK